MTSVKKKVFLDPRLVGAVVAAERDRVGLKQAELARKLEISRSQMCLIERGGRNVTVDMLIAIAHQLDMSPLRLFALMLAKHPRRGRRKSEAIARVIRDLET